MINVSFSGQSTPPERGNRLKNTLQLPSDLSSVCWKEKKVIIVVVIIVVVIVIIRIHVLILILIIVAIIILKNNICN